AKHFTESLALATACQEATLVVSNCTDLADVYLAQGQLDEANRCCQRALELLEGAENLPMHGVTYQIIGKVTSAQARQAEGTERVELLKNASLSFEKALTELRMT